MYRFKFSIWVVLKSAEFYKEKEKLFYSPDAEDIQQPCQVQAKCKYWRVSDEDTDKVLVLKAGADAKKLK